MTGPISDYAPINQMYTPAQDANNLLVIRHVSSWPSEPGNLTADV